MIMIKSIVRPERVDNVLAALMEAGFPAVTKISVVGRGKQRGIKIGEITLRRNPKELLLTVVQDQDKDYAIKTGPRPPGPAPRAHTETERFSSLRYTRFTPSVPESGRCLRAKLKR